MSVVIDKISTPSSPSQTRPNVKFHVSEKAAAKAVSGGALERIKGVFYKKPADSEKSRTSSKEDSPSSSTSFHSISSPSSIPSPTQTESRPSTPVVSSSPINIPSPTQIESSPSTPSPCSSPSRDSSPSSKASSSEIPIAPISKKAAPQPQKAQGTAIPPPVFAHLYPVHSPIEGLMLCFMNIINVFICDRVYKNRVKAAEQEQAKLAKDQAAKKAS